MAKRILSESELEEVALLANAGVSHNIVSRYYGVSPSTVTKYLSNDEAKLPDNYQPADNNRERFRFAQLLYKDSFLNPKLKGLDMILETEVFADAQEYLTNRITDPMEGYNTLLEIIADDYQTRFSETWKQMKRFHKGSAKALFYNMLFTDAVKAKDLDSLYSSADDIFQGMRDRIQKEIDAMSLEGTGNTIETTAKKYLSILEEDERKLVEMKLGIGGPAHSLDDMAKELGFTSARLNTDLQRSYKKLRFQYNQDRP